MGWFKDFVKFATMSKLQERVAGLGVCPSCHKKTLRIVHGGEGLSINQCNKCLKVFVLPSEEQKP